MERNFLFDFSLVGGTALSLKYGHRISVDIDLFTEADFDKFDIIDKLSTYFGKRFFYEEKANPLGIFCYIDEIKVDIVKYMHPLIGAVEEEEAIRFYSIEDIIAMKVAAILRRAKKKDFWDISELLSNYSVDDFITYFFRKFPQQMLLVSIPQVMTYFAEAEEDDDPISLKGQTWDSVKFNIRQHINNFLK